MNAPNGPWVMAGHAADASLPADQLAPPEAQELRRLLGERDQLVAQIREVERRLELLVLSARDRRALTGPVRVHPATGAIEPCATQTENDHG